eukprot:3067000-Rhodomonas_salina.2
MTRRCVDRGCLGGCSATARTGAHDQEGLDAFGKVSLGAPEQGCQHTRKQANKQTRQCKRLVALTPSPCDRSASRWRASPLTRMNAGTRL